MSSVSAKRKAAERFAGEAARLLRQRRTGVQEATYEELEYTRIAREKKERKTAKFKQKYAKTLRARKDAIIQLDMLVKNHARETSLVSYLAPPYAPVHPVPSDVSLIPDTDLPF